MLTYFTGMLVVFMWVISEVGLMKYLSTKEGGESLKELYTDNVIKGVVILIFTSWVGFAFLVGILLYRIFKMYIDGIDEPKKEDIK